MQWFKLEYVCHHCGLWERRVRARVLTAPPDVDVQVAFDDCAALQRLSSIHRVNCFWFADLIAQSVTCATKHTAGGRERESECQGQIPTTHKLQRGKRQWTMTWLLCLTKTWSIFKACFWQTQGHCFMRSLCLTESSSEPWVLCERRIIKSAVRQNQVCSIYKTGSSSTCKKLHGKVNEVIVLLIFYLKSTGVHVKYKVL